MFVLRRLSMRWRFVLGGVLAIVALGTLRRTRDPHSAPATTDAAAVTSPWTAWSHLPKVSILVAAWNEGARIDDLLCSFSRLGYPHRELLLGAGGTDDTLTRARRWAETDPRIVVREQHPGEGKQQTLRRLLPEADGEIMFLTDADCELTDAAFAGTIAPLVIEGAAVATGSSEPKFGQRRNPLVQYQWFTDLAWYDERPRVVDGLLGRNCALRRDALEAAGGFDLPVQTGTDYVLSRLLTAARYEIRFAPGSRVRTEYPETPGRYLRMWRRWNKNLLIHGPRYGAWDDVRGVVTAALLYGFVVGSTLLGIFFAPALIVPAVLFALAAASRFRRVMTGARMAGVRRPWRLVMGVPLYTLLDMLGVLLAVYDAANPDRRGRW